MKPMTTVLILLAVATIAGCSEATPESAATGEPDCTKPQTKQERQDCGHRAATKVHKFEASKPYEWSPK